MGVPGLMRWLQQQFPSACQQLSRIETTNGGGGVHRRAHSLCIDLNGTLHQTARQSNGDLKLVSETVDRIVKLIRPQHTLYLAIDGVPPRIKERLQRERRERYAGNRYSCEREARKVLEGFSLYDITPGTKWMDDMERHLNEFIQQRRKCDDGWEGLRVVVSGYRDPGEGEQKIMDYLRSQRQDNSGGDPEGAHYVWSNDADTVLLSLGIHVRNIVLANERSLGGGLGSLVVTDIDCLRTALVDRYGYLGTDASECEKTQVVDDLVFMSLFAGNDFLPPIALVAGSAADGAGIDTLWTMYSRLPANCRGFRDGCDINYSSLIGLLQKIEEAHEKKELRKCVGVTMLGSQLTAMRVRRMWWEQQRLERDRMLAAGTRGDCASDPIGGTRPGCCACRKSRSKKKVKGRHARPICTCGCHRAKSSKAGQIPFVWAGPLAQLDHIGADGFADIDVATLDGARVLGGDEVPEWHPITDDTNRPQLTLSGLPLLCPELLTAFQTMVLLASGGLELAADRVVVVEEEKGSKTHRHIDGNRAKWMQTAGAMLGQDVRVYDFSTRSDTFEAIHSGWTQWKQAPGPATLPDGCAELATVLVAYVEANSGDLVRAVGIRPDNDSVRKSEPATPGPVALVASSTWDALYEDGRTEHQRIQEYAKWKDAFYRQSYGRGAHQGVARICTYYADALEWTAAYYFTGRVSSWQFAWPEDIASCLLWVAPLASDLSMHFEKKQKQDSSALELENHPLSPPLVREHLVSVMPRESWDQTLTSDERVLARRLAGSGFSDDARQWVRARLLAMPGSRDLPVAEVEETGVDTTENTDASFVVSGFGTQTSSWLSMLGIKLDGGGGGGMLSFGSTGLWIGIIKIKPIMEVDDEVVLPATEQEAEDYYYRVEAAGEDEEEAMTTTATTTTTTTTTVTTTNKTRAPLAPDSPDPHVTAKTISYSPLGMALARPSASALGVESFLGDSDSIFHYHRPTILSAALEPRMSRDVERIRTLTRALGTRRMTHSGQPGGSSEHELRQAALERVVRKLTLTMRSDTFGRQAISEQYRMALDSRRQARRARVAGAREPPHSSPQQAVTARITEEAEDDEWESAGDSDADAQNDDDALTRDALALVRRVHQRAERRRARGGGVSKATGGGGVGKAAGARGKAAAPAAGGGVTAAYARMLTDEQATRRIVSELGQGDTDAVLRLLRAGVAVNTRDSVGRTPLHVACACANREAVQLLLRMGADANAVDRVGNTPLTIAATSAQVDLVVPLLEAGADPKIGKGLVSAMAMVRSRLRLLRAHIRHARAAEKTAAAPTAARARRLHAVAVARQCVDIIHLLRLHSADTPASAPATSSSAAATATGSNTRPDAAAAELDDLSAQLMSMGLSANANAGKGKQSAESSGTGAGYSSDDDDQFDDMLVRFSQLLGDNEADAHAVLNGSAP
ncbi:hypothetical protein IWW48_003805 [Coemansia sp. RSA 1200]|nr:hypothetical protein IWW48_003805 [Coemansia sp. RSA 1200]